MTLTKKECPECTTITVTFNPQNSQTIRDVKEELKALGRRRNNEQIINKIIGEWAIHKINGNI